MKKNILLLAGAAFCLAGALAAPANAKTPEKYAVGLKVGYLDTGPADIDFGSGLQKVEFDSAVSYGVEVVRYEKRTDTSLAYVGSRPQVDKNTIPTAGLDVDIDFWQLAINHRWYQGKNPKGEGVFYGFGAGFRKTSFNFNGGGPLPVFDKNSMDINLLLGWQTPELGNIEIQYTPDEESWSISLGLRYGI